VLQAIQQQFENLLIKKNQENKKGLKVNTRAFFNFMLTTIGCDSGAYSMTNNLFEDHVHTGIISRE